MFLKRELNMTRMFLILVFLVLASAQDTFYVSKELAYRIPLPPAPAMSQDLNPSLPRSCHFAMANRTQSVGVSNGRWVVDEPLDSDRVGSAAHSANQAVSVWDIFWRSDALFSDFHCV